MGELPTGGGAFIAAGGCRGGRRIPGEGEASSGLWTFRRGRELCLAPKAGLWGSQPSFVTQSEGEGSRVGDAQPTSFVNSLCWEHELEPILVDSTESSLINQSSELRLRKKAGLRDAATPCGQAPTFGDVPNTRRRL